ncbi:hypothetical protein D3C85_1067960 [compost metagenome]
MQGMTFEYSEDGEEYEEVFVPCVDGVISLKTGIYRSASKVHAGVTIVGAGHSRLMTDCLLSLKSLDSYRYQNQRTGKGERKRNRKDRWK